MLYTDYDLCKKGSSQFSLYECVILAWPPICKRTSTISALQTAKDRMVVSNNGFNSMTFEQMRPMTFTFGQNIHVLVDTKYKIINAEIYLV